MIELQNVSAGYGSYPVLDRVSLTFPDGQITAVIGPNGCGKSTLLRTVMGLHPPAEGQVLADGVPISALSPRQLAQRIAYLPQNRGVPNITAHRMVLHDLCLALRWSHQTAVLDRGKLRFCGTPEEVFSSGVLDKVFGVKLGRLQTENSWQYYYD